MAAFQVEHQLVLLPQNSNGPEMILQFLTDGRVRVMKKTHPFDPPDIGEPHGSWSTNGNNMDVKWHCKYSEELEQTIPKHVYKRKMIEQGRQNLGTDVWTLDERNGYPPTPQQSHYLAMLHDA